jgi:8-oxo-dGTP pyrophosphatase MutT (NUDIX family)
MSEFKRFPSMDQQGKPALVTLASGPVIIRDGKVLLDKHGDDPFWKFPGGKVRDDESLRQTAIREVMEELGLTVELSGEPVVLTFQREREGMAEVVVLVHYQASTLGEPVKQRDVREFAWHDMDALPDDCAPNIKPVVAAFRQRLGS